MACKYEFGKTKYTESGLEKYLTPDVLVKAFNIETVDQKTVKKLLNTWLPNLDVNEHLGLITNITESQLKTQSDVFGEIKNGAIKLYGTKAGKYNREAAYHESLHLMLKYGASPKWRSRLMKYAKEKYGNKTEDEYEHLLAKELQEYEEISNPRSIVEKIFIKIVSFLKSIVDPKYTPLKRFYDLLRAGHFRNSINSIPSDYQAKFSFMERYFNDVNHNEFKQLLNVIKSYYYIFNNAAFTDNTLVSRSDIESRIHIELLALKNDLQSKLDSGKLPENLISNANSLLKILSIVLSKDVSINQSPTVLSLITNELFPTLSTKIDNIDFEDLGETELNPIEEATEGITKETQNREYEDLSSKLTSSIKTLINSVPVTNIPDNILNLTDPIEKWNELAKVEFINFKSAYRKLMELFTEGVNLNKPNKEVIKDLENAFGILPDAQGKILIRHLLDIFNTAFDTNRITLYTAANEEGEFIDHKITDRVMIKITPKTKLINTKSNKRIKLDIERTDPYHINAGGITFEDLSNALLDMASDNLTRLGYFKRLHSISGLAMGIANSMKSNISPEALIYSYIANFDKETGDRFFSSLYKVLENKYPSNNEKIELINRAFGKADILRTYNNLTSSFDVKGKKNKEEFINENLDRLDFDSKLAYLSAEIAKSSSVLNRSLSSFLNNEVTKLLTILETVRDHVHKTGSEEEIKLMNEVYDKYTNSINDVLINANEREEDNKKSVTYATPDPFSNKVEYHLFYKSKADSPVGDMLNMSYQELEEAHRQGHLVKFSYPNLDINEIVSNVISEKAMEVNGVVDKIGYREKLTNLFKMVEYRDLIADMTNLFSSTVEKDFMVGALGTEYLEDEDGGSSKRTFKYYKARGHGLNAQYKSIVRDAFIAYYNKLGHKEFMNKFLTIKETTDIKVIMDKFFEFLKDNKIESLVKYNTDIRDRYDLASAFQEIAVRFLAEAKRDNLSSDEIETILQSQNSRLAEIGKILSEYNPQERASSIISGEKKQLYKFTTGSYAFEVVNSLARKFDKGGHIKVLDKLKEPLYRKNLIVDSNLIFSNLLMHDSMRSEYSGRATTFTKENKLLWFNRNYRLGWQNAIELSNTTKNLIPYYQFVYQPSSASRIPMAKVGILTKKSIIKGIRYYNEQLEENNIGNILDTFKDVNTGSLMRFENHSKMTDEQLYKEFLERIREASERNREFFSEELKKSSISNSTSKAILSKLMNNDNYSDIVKDFEGNTTEETLFNIFYLNNYVNGYFLNQLLYGDFRQYGNSKTIVKRSSGVHGPVIHPRVGEGYTSSTARVYTVKDSIYDSPGESASKGFKTAIEAFLHSIFPNKTVDEIKEMAGYYDSGRVNSTDGQGIMSSRRFADLQKGYGNGFRFGRVNKPMYFGDGKIDTVNENGEKETHLVSTHLKYSNFAITPELASKFPELAALDKWMQDNNIDELLFESAFKVGRPKGNYPTFQELIDGTHEINPSMVVTIDNSRYGMQFNATAKPNKGNVQPTQLISFLNMESDPVLRNTVFDTYKTLAMIMHGETAGYVDMANESLRKFLTDVALRSEDQEHIRSLLKEGVSPNIPFIETTTIIQAAAYMSKVALRYKLPGGKLVLQSAETINYTRPLNFKTENGKIIAEVVMPKAMLSKTQLEALSRGESVFATADGFAVRIPTSEYHSAIVFKVVDTYDELDTNVIIVPKEITAIAGSDFDVDSLFIYTFNFKGNRPYGFKEKDGKFVWDEQSFEEDFKSNFKKSLENRLINNIVTILTAEHNADRMFLPINKNIFMDPSIKDSPADILSQFGLKPVEDLDLSDLQHGFTAYRDVSSGGQMIGIIASFIRAYSALRTASTENSFPKVKDDKHSLQIVTKDGTQHLVKGLTETDLEGNKISTVLAALINLALDNESDQFLNKININENTMTLFNTMIAVGIPLRMATKIFLTDTVKKLLESKNTTKDLKSILNDLSKSNITIDDTELRESELDDLLNNKLTSDDKTIVEYKVANMLHTLDTGIVRVMRGVNSISKLNRKMPVKPDEFAKFEASLKKLFGEDIIDELEEAYEQLLEVDTSEMEKGSEELRHFEKVLKGITVDNNIMDISNFLANMPHIAYTAATTVALMRILGKNLVVFNKDVQSIVSKYYGIKIDFNRYNNNYMLASLYNKFMYTLVLDEHNIPKYKSNIYKGNKAYLKYGVEAFASDIARVALAVQKADLEASTTEFVSNETGRTIKIFDTNLFLSFLNISNQKEYYRIGTHSIGTLTSTDYFSIRKSFYDLRKYSFEIDENGEIKVKITPLSEVPSDQLSNVQRVFLNYMIISTALSGSLNTYSFLIPPRILKEHIQTTFDKITDELVTEDNEIDINFLRNTFKQFLVQISVNELATVTSAKKVGTVLNKHSELPSTVKLHSSSSGHIATNEGNRYFDLLIREPDNTNLEVKLDIETYSETEGEQDALSIGKEIEDSSLDTTEEVENSVKEKVAPMFVTYGKRVYVVSDKIGDLILYQRVKKIDRNTGRLKTMDPATNKPYHLHGGRNYFSSELKSIPVLDVYGQEAGTLEDIEGKVSPDGKVIEIKQDLHSLIGETVALVPANSATRLGRRFVKLVGKVEGKENLYEIEDVHEGQDLSSLDDFYSPSYAVTPDEAKTLLKELREQSNNLSIIEEEKDIMGRPTGRYYKDSTTGNEYMRLTYPLNPIINNMRARPYTEYKKSTFAEDEADKLWEGKEPTDKLTIPSVSPDPITKEEFIKKVKEMQYAAAVRGTIAHMYIQKNLETDAKKRAQLQQEINAIINVTGVHPLTQKWVDNKWKTILEMHNIDVEHQNIESEITIKSDIWGSASTVDLLAANSDGTFSIVDFKFGKYFNLRISNRIWKFGRAGRRTLYQNPKEQAKLEVMLRALMLKTERDIQFKDLIVAWLPSEDNLNYTDYDKFVDVESHLAMIESFLKDEYEKATAEEKENTIYGKLKKLPHFDKLFDPKEYTSGYNQSNLRDVNNTGKSPSSRVQELMDLLIKEVQFQYSPRFASSDLKTKSINRATELVEQILDLMPDLPDIEGFEKDLSTLHLLTTSGRDSTHPMVQLVSKLYDEALNKSRAKYHVFRSVFEEKRDALIELYYQRTGKTFTPGRIKYLRRVWTSIDPVQFWEWAYITEKTDDGTIHRRMPVSEADWNEQAKKFPYIKDSNGNIRSEYKSMIDHVVKTYDYFFLDSKGHKALANRVATYRHDPKSNSGVRDVTNIELATSTHERGFRSKFEYISGKFFPIVAKTEDEFGHMGMRWLNKDYRKEMYRRWFTWHNEAVYSREFSEDEMIPMRYLGNPYLVSSGNYSLNIEEQYFKFVKYHLHKEYMDPVYAITKAMQYRLRYGKAGINGRIGANFDKWAELFLKKNINGLRQRWFEGGLVGREVGVQNLYGRDEDGNPDLSKGGFFNSFNWVKFFNWASNSASGPLMWLKPLQGTANGIFSYMYGLKEGLKGDIVKSKLGKKLGIDEDYIAFTTTDIAAATKDFFEMQKDAMLGTLEKNKLYIMVKKLGYMPEESQFWSNVRLDNRIHRGLLQEESMMYIFHSLPEEALSMIILGAQLRSMKIKAKRDSRGNLLNRDYAGRSFWDMYKTVRKTDAEGNEYWDTEWKDNYVRGVVNISKDPNNPEYKEITELTTDEVRRMMYIYQSMYGNYRQDERVVFEYYVLGKLFLQLKRYIPSLLRKMFASRGEVHSYGKYYEVGKTEDGTPVLRWKARVMEGRWRTLMGLFGHYVLGLSASKYNSNGKLSKLKKLINVEATHEYEWSKLSEGQKEIVAEFLATATFIGTMLAGYAWLFGGSGSNDDREKIILKYYQRIMLNFSQEWNVIEPVRDILKNGLPVAFRVWGDRISSTATMTWSLFMWGLGNEDLAFTKTGSLRGTNAFLRVTPIVASYVEVANFIANEHTNLSDFATRIVK